MPDSQQSSPQPPADEDAPPPPRPEGRAGEPSDPATPPVSPAAPQGGAGVSPAATAPVGTARQMAQANVTARVAYNLALFSLLPFVGIPVGVAAVVLGVLGLVRYHEEPARGGATHAWIGIVGGAATVCVWCGVLIYYLTTHRYPAG